MVNKKALLDGVCVVELTEYLSGPYCGMLLGDMGADVIKIERPETGDVYRAMGPTFKEGEASNFLSLNRNKRSLTLNLKSEKGKEILKKLLEKADVLLENYRPGVLEKLGFGYDVVKEWNPAIIYSSISGYGQDGPYHTKGGFDLIIQGMTGLMEITGEPDRNPAKMGIPITDFGSGLYCMQGILAALYYREKTGAGQRIETSLFESGTALQIMNLVNYDISGNVPSRMGSASPLSAPYQALKTKDIFITVGTGSAKLWQKFCKVTGLEELMEDERFLDNASRVKNYLELAEIIETRLREKPGCEWIKLLEEEGIPCGAIRSMEQLLEDEQLHERGMLIHYEHPKAGTIHSVRYPVHFSIADPVTFKPSPLLGQHREQILEEIGYQPEEISGLIQQGIL